MNRIQSMLAAGLTTALSTGGIAAFAVAQNVSGASQGAPSNVVAVPDPAIAAEVSRSASSGSGEPQVVYRDNEPIYVTRQIVSGSNNGAAQEATAASSSPSPSVGSSGAIPSVGPSSSSTPVAPAASPPIAQPIPSATSSVRGGDDDGPFHDLDDDHGGDRDDDTDDDHGDHRDDEGDDDDHRGRDHEEDDDD